MWKRLSRTRLKEHREVTGPKTKTVPEIIWLIFNLKSNNTILKLNKCWILSHSAPTWRMHPPRGDVSDNYHSSAWNVRSFYCHILFLHANVQIVKHFYRSANLNILCRAIKTQYFAVAPWMPVSQPVTPASGACPPPSKLKQGGQKDIFQFCRCKSFHLVIQMSFVFCVNRCPYPASFINISWLGFSMQLAVPLPHRY